MFKKRQRGEEGKRGRYPGPQTVFVLTLYFTCFACLAGRSHAQSLESIRSGVASGNIELIRNALYQIKNLHSESASRLAVPALTNIDKIVRATAANAVVFLPKTEAARVLLPLLADKDEFVRGEAAFALGEVRDASAAAALIRTLGNDRSRVVKAAAATALGKIGDAVAIGPLGKIFAAKPSEASEFLRRSVAHAIGAIAEAVNKQPTTTTTPENFLPDKYKRGFAQMAGTGDPVTSQMSAFQSANTILIKVLQNGNEADDTRREAAFALGTIGDPESAAALRSHLNAPDNYLAEICKEALLKIERQK